MGRKMHHNGPERPVYGMENYLRANDFLQAMYRSRKILRYNEMHDLRHLALRGYLDEAWAKLRDIIGERSDPSWSVRRA